MSNNNLSPYAQGLINALVAHIAGIEPAPAEPAPADPEPAWAAAERLAAEIVDHYADHIPQGSIGVGGDHDDVVTFYPTIAAFGAPEPFNITAWPNADGADVTLHALEAGGRWYEPTTHSERVADGPAAICAAICRLYWYAVTPRKLTFATTATVMVDPLTDEVLSTVVLTPADAGLMVDAETGAVVDRERDGYIGAQVWPHPTWEA